MKKIIINLIRVYQKTISPLWVSNPFGLLNSTCRFYPTCSDYAIDAVAKYGAWKGVLKSVNRVLRCNPWANSGIDRA
jgi:hypothetical protein